MSTISCVNDDDCKRYSSKESGNLTCYNGKCAQVTESTKLSTAGIVLIILVALGVLALFVYIIKKLWAKRKSGSAARPSARRSSARR